MGISIPEDWRKVGCYQLYATFQLNTMLGGGLYAGGGYPPLDQKAGARCHQALRLEFIATLKFPSVGVAPWACPFRDPKT